MENQSEIESIKNAYASQIIKQRKAMKSIPEEVTKEPEVVKKNASEIIQELRSQFEAGDPLIHQLLQKIAISVDEEGLIKLVIPQRYQFFEPFIEEVFKGIEYLVEIECDHSYSCSDCGKSQ